MDIRSDMSSQPTLKGQAYWDAYITLSQSAKHHYTPENITSPYANHGVDLTIFVSCYNEAVFIVDTLNTIITAMQMTRKTFEIIVIDDGSKDESLVCVKHYIEQHPDVDIILRANKKNKGLAQNYVDGAFMGRGKYYRLFCGDNSEPTETIVKVVNAIGEADIIVPYYTLFQNKSSYRQMISKIYTKIINIISGNKIRYYNGLHIHLRHNIMRWHATTRGFGFQAALLCTLINLGFTYKEIAVITIERRGGRGNAITWKNVRSVSHTMLGLLIQRLAPRT